MLKKSFVRNGRNKLIASVTAGFSDGSTVIRDSEGHIVGRTSDRFKLTRDNHGIVSLDTSDPGLIIGGKDE